MRRIDFVVTPEIMTSGSSAGDVVESTGYWIIVGSQGNLDRTRELGFTVQGIKSRHRRKAERMRPGDRIAYYVTGRKVFAATATVTSTFVESHERIWSSGDPRKADEDYPYRVQIEPDVVLADGDAVDAEPVARQMSYVAKWPAANWTLAFQGNVHVIAADDFMLIRDALIDHSPSSVSAG